MSNDVQEALDKLTKGQQEIADLLRTLIDKGRVQDWYTTDEFARITGKAEATIREHCRYGRLKADRRRSGRGAYPAWVLSHDELLRYQREGLLPDVRLIQTRA